MAFKDLKGGTPGSMQRRIQFQCWSGHQSCDPARSPQSDRSLHGFEIEESQRPSACLCQTSDKPCKNLPQLLRFLWLIPTIKSQRDSGPTWYKMKPNAGFSHNEDVSFYLNLNDSAPDQTYECKDSLFWDFWCLSTAVWDSHEPILTFDHEGALDG